MKVKTLYLLVSALFFSLIAIDCGGKKTEVIPVGELISYKDPLYGFEISYPKEWTKNCEIANARFYNSPDDISRFADPTSGSGKGGVQVKLIVEKSEEALNKLVKFQKDTIKLEGRIIDKEENVKFDNQDANKVYFTSNYGKGNLMKSFRIFVSSDSLFTYLDCSAFNEDWERYQLIFDAITKTVKLGKIPSTSTKIVTEVEPPSERFENYSTSYFTISYPDNFNFSSPSKGTNEFSVELKGRRQDCTIRIDVFPAKGLTVEKVVNQNKAKYKATSATSITLDGTSAQYINYSLRKDASSRVYFVVKNDKVIRITLNWFTPQDESYRPAFEKVVSSLKLK